MPWQYLENDVICQAIFSKKCEKLYDWIKEWSI